MKTVQCSVKIQNDISEQFETNKGLRQADALACLLFNVVLEKVMRDAGILNSGTIYNKSTQVLAYADDINIIGLTQCVSLA
jgi:sorting nexin-29